MRGLEALRHSLYSKVEVIKQEEMKGGREGGREGEKEKQIVRYFST